MIPILLGIATVFGSVYYFLLRSDRLSHIPGPRRLPILGTSLHLTPGKQHQDMQAMARKYGPVYKLDFQGKPSVVVCDFEGIYQVLVSKSADFAGRPSFYLADLLTEGQSGITRTDAGARVRGRRKLVHQYLKQYGAGLQHIERVTSDAARAMIQGLETLDGGAVVDISKKLTLCVMEIVAVMVIGERLTEQTADDIQRVYEEVDQALGSTIASELINAFPVLRHLPNPAYEGIKSSIALKSSLMTAWIRDDHPDSFIRAMNNMTPADAEKYQITELKHKVQTIYDFFGGGVVTTRSALGNLINVLVHNVPIQEKLHQEIISTIGDSLPTLSDREHMPYHMATLLEINRYASFIPLSIPHKSTRDTTININGTPIPIPAQTEILVHLWALHHDEEFWIEPYAFDPSRFLSEDGGLVPADHPNRKHVMAFGAGHRVCVGEVFALSRMFLILANLIQTFRILPETTIEAQPSCDPREMMYGNVMFPNPYKVRLVPW